MGPTLDATTRQPIFKHRVLDQEGIVYVGARIMPKQVGLIYLRETSFWLKTINLDNICAYLP